jgi:DTW domain-containing protein YfiP
MSRLSCNHCFRIQSLCLCDSIQTFEIEPLIVLLVHPREFMKTIGTVRVVKLSLTGSIMIRGHGKNFDSDPTLASILANPNHHCMILFPEINSINLSTTPSEEIKNQIPPGKRLVIFVIDGTWSAAKNMIRDSAGLRALPKLSFDVNAPSIYEVRKQPNSHCLSTVEAVSVLIENLKAKGICAPKPADGHLKMIEGFRKLISVQVEFESRPEHRHKKKFRKGMPEHFKAD